MVSDGSAFIKEVWLELAAITSAGINAQAMEAKITSSINLNFNFDMGEDPFVLAQVASAAGYGVSRVTYGKT